MSIIYRIRGHGRGWVFTPTDFVDLNTRAAVDQTLSRLARDGTIRRIGRGIYDYPRQHARIGTLAPDPVQVRHAVARRGGLRVLPGGAAAANALGLSTQVPARADLLTDGPSRRVKVGRQVIRLRHTSPRKLIGAGHPWRTAIQALMHLGPDGADAHAAAHLRAVLGTTQRARLLENLRLAPVWMHPSIREIASNG